MRGKRLKDKNVKDIDYKDIDMTTKESIIIIYKDGNYEIKFPSEIGYMVTCIYWKGATLKEVFKKNLSFDGTE